jgi:enoyl-CoA hydratase/carnithine racemase
LKPPSFKYLDISNEGGILLIKINNPPHNHLSSAIFSELDPARELMGSQNVEAVIFTGKGRCFSKGADIEEIGGPSPSVDEKNIAYGNEICNFVSDLTKPAIAAINGACFGAGLELALACHIRLCADNARIGLPELSIGVIPGLGGIQRLTRIVGEAKALEMILLGDMISSERAYELNLVSRVFPKKDFLSRVLMFTKTILAADREAIQETLKLVALTRPDNEIQNISEAGRSFLRLVSKRVS